MIGKTVMHDWTVEALLGQGSFGAVYKISKEEYGVKSSSALKVITVPQSESDVMAIMSDGMDERSATTYFEGVVGEIVREVSIMSQLKGHPNVVAYEDHKVIKREDTIGWDILIRMELLTSLISNQLKNGFTLKQVVKMGMELTDALVLCHSRGLIHRDIKPDNIFMNEYGVFKLGDFGVARTVENAMSVKSKKGTEVYMAPEVYLGRSYDDTVDLYSLGIVLYKCLNGNRLPFLPPANQPIKPGDKEAALIERISGKPLPRPVFGDDELVAIINKACAFDAKDRYQSASEMLDDLTSYYGKHQKELDVKVLNSSTKKQSAAPVTVAPTSQMVSPTSPITATVAATVPTPVHTAPQMVAPQVVVPQAPQPVAQPIAQPVVPQPVVSQQVAPQPIATQPVAAQPTVLKFDFDDDDDCEKTVGIRRADSIPAKRAATPTPVAMQNIARPGAETTPARTNTSSITPVTIKDNADTTSKKKKIKTSLIIVSAVLVVALIAVGAQLIFDNSEASSKRLSKDTSEATTTVVKVKETKTTTVKSEETTKESIDGKYTGEAFDTKYSITLSGDDITYTSKCGDTAKIKSGKFTYNGDEIVVKWDNGGSNTYKYSNGIVMTVFNDMGTKSKEITLKK